MSVAACVLILFATSLTQAQDVGIWRRHVVAMANPSYTGNPFELEVDATFTHTNTGQVLVLPGYYDGSDTWKIGFMPIRLGEWTYVTSSLDPELDGVTGSINCIASGLPGMLGADPLNPKKWKFSAGNYVVPMGFRLEIFFEDSTEAEFIAAADVLANEVRGTMFDTRLLDEQVGQDGRIDYIFEGDWQLHQFDLANWTRFEQRLEILTERGLGVHLMFYSDDLGAPQWNGFTPTEELVIRYVVARTCGYPVLWYNSGIDIVEYRSPSWIDWFGEQVQALDPYGHPVSSRHGGNGGGTHVMATQTFDSEGLPVTADAPAMVDHFLQASVPVSMDDCWGENRPSHPDKDHTPAEIRRAFWKCLVAGGVGGLVRGSDGHFHVFNFGEDLESEQWLGMINPFIEQKLGSHFASMIPEPDLLIGNGFALADPERYFVVALSVGTIDHYDPAGGPFTIDLSDVPATRLYTAAWFDPRTGQETSLGQLNGAEQHTFTPPTNDDWVLYMIEVFGTNEPPVVSIAANQVEVDMGQPVTFVSDVNDENPIASYEWNFGDTIITGTGAPPTTIDHSWDFPGLYTVQLTVTDAGDPPRSSSSQAINIAVAEVYAINATASVVRGDAPLTVDFSTVVFGVPVGQDTFTETGGAVALEAESFMATDLNNDPNNVNWGITTAAPGFVGSGYIEVAGPYGTRGTFSAGCKAEYDIFFSTVGTYTVWLRRNAPSSSADSLFMGLDGSNLGGVIDNTGASDWSWRSAVSFNITKSGVYTLSVHRREAGYRIDRFYITRNGDTPTGLGPAASPLSQALQFSWNFGDGATQSGSALVDVSHNYESPGIYPATVTVTTPGGESVSDTISIQALTPGNNAPAVDAGPDQLVFFDMSASLSGSVSDDGLPTSLGTGANGLVVEWSVVSGPGGVTFDDPSDANTPVSFSDVGVYTLRLSANDGELTSDDTVLFDVQTPPNAAPTVNAGADQTITLPASATVTATASDDGRPNPPSILTTQWTLVSGPGSALFADASALTTVVSFDIPGLYDLAFTGSDSELTVEDRLLIEVLPVPNAAPMVSAGPDQQITLPASATLAGSANDDGLPAPSALQVAWSSIAGPGTVTFADAAQLVTSASFSSDGDYTLRLSVGDGEFTTTDDVLVQVSLPPNAPPTVNAGVDLTVTLPAAAQLNGVVTDDASPLAPAPLQVSWSLVAGPGTVTFAAADSVTTSANFSTDGDYTLQLRADDGEFVVTDSVVVTVLPIQNQPPGVSAGIDQSVTLPEVALLNGNITDDGLPNPPAATTSLWSQVSGPATVTFGNAGSAQTTAAFSVDGVYQLRLLASDGASQSSDTVIVTVFPVPNMPPVVNAGTDATVTLPDTGLLQGSLNDDGLPVGSTATLLWSQQSGPSAAALLDPNNATTEVSFDTVGSYTFLLTVDDGELSASDEVVVEVLPVPNAAPMVSAGSDQIVTLPNAASLSASISDDGLPQPTALSITWSQLSGPGGVVFGDANAAATGATFPSEGDYTLQVLVSDGELSATDSIGVQVLPIPNQPPVVSAGAALTVVYPNAATLDGTASDDGLPAGSSLLFSWSKLSGPGSVTFGSIDALDTVANFSLPGTYLLQLNATDGDQSSISTVQVVVEPPANEAPVVSAGPNVTVELSVGAMLSGSVSDDGFPLSPGVTSIQWSQLSGPGLVTFSDATSVTSAAQFSADGSYQLELSANDGELVSFDVVTINVFDSSVNHEPTVDLGADFSVVFGAVVSLSSTVTDDALPQPQTLTSSWTQISGPATAVFAAPNSSNTTVELPQLGSYELQLAVSDGELIGTDTVVVTVEAPPNQPPVVSAGANQVVAITGESQLSGIFSDDGWPQQGVPLVFSWTQVAGPGTATFADPASANTSATFDVAGVYTVKFSAFDGELTGEDTLFVDVQDIANTAPSINAGIDREITIAQTLTLNASVVDDGLPQPSSLTVLWSKGGGPGNITFSDLSSASTTAQFSAPGFYVVRFAVTDGDLQSTDTVGVTVVDVPNVAPVANAGADLSTTELVAIALSGSFSDDGLPPPATITSSWAQISGPGLATFNDSSLLNATVTFDMAGSYELELTVSDGELSASDRVIVTVNPVANQAPMVSAGATSEVTLGQTLLLQGTITDDGLPESTITSLWSQLSGPGLASFNNAGATTTGVDFSASGVYQLVLTADDGELQSSDTVVVTVNDPPNAAPGVDAGVDTSVTLPSILALNATVVDDALPAGSTLSFSWSQLSGPGVALFDDSSAEDTSVSFDLDGIYVLQLEATDGELTAADTVVIEVFPAVNQAPIVNAGNDQSLVLPATATLLGNANDDGLPTATLSLTWSLVSGPAPLSFADSSSASTSATFSVAGSYVLELSASDGELTSSDTVTIEVDDQVNAAPLVDAGPDLTINLSDEATLSGSASDDGLPNGSVLSVQWSLLSGPGSVNFANATTAVTSATFSTDGLYELQLSASDGVLSVTDSVNVMVDPIDLDNVNVFASADVTSGEAPLTVQFTGEAIGGSATVGDGNYQESGGMVVVEAEYYSALQSNGDPAAAVWEIATDSVGFAADGYLTTTGSGSNGSFDAGCEASYDIEFATPGSYHVWLRRRATSSASNSAFVGLDGVIIGPRFDNSSQGDWGWIRHSVTVDVTPGVHSLQLRRREFGYEVDRLLLTIDPAFTPTAEGPGESQQGASYAFAWDFGDGNSSTQQSPSHIYTDAGDYLATLTVTFGNQSGADALSILVTQPVNDAPLVDAGPDLTVTLPATASLAGTVVDDGLPLLPGATTVQWSVLSGPGSVVFSDENAASTDATFSQAGVYELQLSADDGEQLRVDSTLVTVEQSVLSADEYASDTDTLALYHFNGDFNDSSGNMFDLTVEGGAHIATDNSTWMANPSGGVARMSALGDRVVVAIPDLLLFPNEGVEITVDARFYVRNYLAWGSGNYDILSLYQEWDSNFVVLDGKWNNPRNPTAGSSNVELIDAATWAEVVTPGEWHHLRMIYSSGLVQIVIDGQVIGSGAVVPTSGRSNDWALILGNFDGDIDEVRISSTVRTD